MKKYHLNRKKLVIVLTILNDSGYHIILLKNHCIVFCPHSNAFIEVMVTWSHAYQRIDEHENSKDHIDVAEAYFLNSTKIILISFYFQNKDL